MDNTSPPSELKISPNLHAAAAIAIKPHNYFNELSPEQQEEHRRLEAMITEAERCKKIGETVDIFESFQRWLKTTDNSESAKLKPKAERKPLLEEVAIASGIIRVHRPPSPPPTPIPKPSTSSSPSTKKKEAER